MNDLFLQISVYTCSGRTGKGILFWVYIKLKKISKEQEKSCFPLYSPLTCSAIVVDQMQRQYFEMVQKLPITSTNFVSVTNIEPVLNLWWSYATCISGGQCPLWWPVRTRFLQQMEVGSHWPSSLSGTCATTPMAWWVCSAASKWIQSSPSKIIYE